MGTTPIERSNHKEADMRDETRMLLESMGRLFEDHCTKPVAEAAEAGTFPDALWQAVSDSGVPLGGVADSGVEWSDLYAVLRVAGRYAAPIPLAETMLAAWAASSAGFSVDERPMTVGPVRAGETLRLARDGNGWRLSGRASRLPWGRDAGRIALLATDPDGRTMVVFGDGVQGARLPAGGTNMAGEPRDTYEFAGLGLSGNEVAPAAPGIDQAALYRRGALARATMMAGAMERALDTAVNYAQERRQFGRPIGKFQAVQQNLAVMAGQVAAAGAAADAGVEALAIEDSRKQEFLVAIAKTRVGEAATLASEIAHQVHGAIGFTKEYALQLSTRRLWSWRDEFGGESEWATKIGAYICAQGADALWSTLTDA
jgi:alkylation response protein AidB-like acyl-CoA dehydrogenase